MTIAREQAVAAAGARVLAGDRIPAHLAFSTDTRSLARGEAFVALRGERFDGHAFLATALERGASTLVVDDETLVPPGAPALVVADTTAAYLAFAGEARRASHAAVLAITGSAGKTTTKAFAQQILERAGGSDAVAATPSNENNEIGVAKLLLSTEPRTRFVVVEMGARHPNELEQLARAARPDVAILTNVGDAHLEIFGSREALARTKWGIFSTGAHAVLNASDAESRRRAASLAAPVIWFDVRDDGVPVVGGPDIQAVELGEPARGVLGHDAERVYLVVSDEGVTLCVRRDGREERHPVSFGIAGRHNLENAVAAAAGAIALGLSPADVAASLASLELPPGRYERMACDGFALIYDAYNASAAGTIATLRSFATEPARRRIAVLGGMAELGGDAARLHRDVGAAAADANLAVILAGGEFAADTERGALEAGMARASVVTYRDNPGALAWLRDNLRPGDLVLLKASRRYRLEEVAEGLRGAHAG